MARELTNEFSWSKSRHEKFKECLRAYHLHYYASWGGWSDRAPPEVRQLYLLKKLGNRFTWAGSVVHDAVKSILLRIKMKKELPKDELIARVQRLMREDWKHSKVRAYWYQKHRKDFSGLVEHEYAEPVSAAEWKANWELAREALEWFHQSRWIPLARSLQPHQWVEVDDKSFDNTVFHMEGVKVFAIPDFAYIDDEGNPVVVDWKTGTPREGYDEQVLGYALYLNHRYELRLDRMQAAIVYLNGGVERLVHVDEAALARFKAYFHKSVEGMRAVLADPVANTPKPQAAFPMTSDPAVCARCVFRRPCGREGAVANPAAGLVAAKPA